MRLLVTAFALVLTYASASTQTVSDNVLEKMGIFHTNFPQEKVYVHHDKPNYVLGEIMWMKVYLLDAILHQTLTPSQQVVVELVDPNDEIMASEIILIENGGGAADFRLGPKWSTGRYMVRAYTEYQRNFETPFFFEKEIRVYDAYSEIRNPDISSDEIMASGDNVLMDFDQAEMTVGFFPEGGDMIDGIQTTVGVNIYGADTEGVKAAGIVEDQSGNVVARFNTHQTGLGFFNIVPKSGDRYLAKINGGGEGMEFKLPDVKSQGYSLRVAERRDTLNIRMATTYENGLQDAFVIGHLRGQLFGVIAGLTGEEALVRVPLTGTPDGILHFTLFTSNGRPVSERLVFVDREDNSAPVEMTVAETPFGRRKEVLVNIDQTSDSSWVNGSITVTDLGVATPHKYASHIESYLLMESDLRGKIPDPGFFFEGSPASLKLRDVLMLTHGWRRFVWDDLLDDPAVGIDYLPENSLSVRGYVTKYGKPDKRIKSTVFMSVLTGEFSMNEVTTGDDGVFEFGGIQDSDTLTIFLQANKYKEPKPGSEDEPGGPDGNSWLDVYIQKESIPLVQRKTASIDPPMDPNVMVDYFSQSRNIQIVDSSYSDVLTYELGEVVITEEKYDPVEEEHKNNMLYKNPDHRLIPDSMLLGSQARNVFELMRGQVPGVEVVGTFPNYSARIRGAGSIKGQTTATFVLDGMPVDAELINTFPVSRVAFIDVLKGLSKATLYGSSGNGVIAIYSKTQSQYQQSATNPGTLTYVHPGYYDARVFYSPDYGALNSDKPDFRNTLYWNPSIFLEPNGSAYLTFYSADKSSVYSVRFEGITADGTPVVRHATFEVR